MKTKKIIYIPEGFDPVKDRERALEWHRITLKYKRKIKKHGK